MSTMLHDSMAVTETGWRAGRVGPALADAGAAHAPAVSACGPAPWVRLMLDAIDYGAGLMLPDGTLAYANPALRSRLASGEVLRLDASRRLHCPDPAAQQRLAEARHDACTRGLRRLVALGRPGTVLALVGITPLQPGTAQPCLVLAQRAASCERLSLAMFARQHGLTQAETRVLQGLTDGDSPEAIGAQLGVRITTVRTHIVHLRAKTGAASLRELMQCVATLPPIVHALGPSAPTGWPLPA